MRFDGPEIARSVVVFPAPFAPRTANDLALPDDERHVVQRLDPPVAGGDAVELEPRSHASPSGSGSDPTGLTPPSCAASSCSSSEPRYA